MAHPHHLSLPQPSGRPTIYRASAGAAVTALLLWFLTEPLPQDLVYHDFADARAVLGVPNTLNVLSNLAFCVVGILGLVSIGGRPSRAPGGLIYLVFFAGVFFTGLGSAYYHWAPDNVTLVWDRLPMTIGFMAFTCLVVYERYSAALGRGLFPLFLAAGIASVGYWVWQDDLRPYFAVQFGPVLLLPLMIWRTEGPGTGWLWLTIAFYAAAKLLELSDQQALELSRGWVSGHTLKHLAAAAGACMIVAKFRRQTMTAGAWDYRRAVSQAESELV